jgi:hypothetical protein
VGIASGKLAAKVMTAGGGTLAAPSGAWTGRRFLLAVALLFLAQVGIILLVGEPPGKVVSEAAAPVVFRALAAPMDQEQISQSFFVADPTVFASATPHGFSGRAWLRFQPVKYAPADELEAPSPLALDTRHLGTKLPLGEATNQVPFELAEQRGPQLEPLPVFPTQSLARRQSLYYLEGPLAGRQIGPVFSLPSWPANQLLTNSVVQFAVNRSGEVVMHRLASRCGLPDADMEALSITRKLRFSPSGAGAPEILWSKAIFQWQTLELNAK